jgi:signal transduction histidine kinase
MQLSLRQQFSLTLGGVVSMALLVAALSLLYWESRRIAVDVQRELKALATFVGNRSSAALAFRDDETAQESLDALTSLSVVGQACLLDGDGRIAATYPRSADRQQCQATGAERAQVESPVIVGDQTVGTIRMWSAPGIEGQRLKPSMLALLGALLAGGLGAMLASQPLLGWVTRPISNIGRVASNIVRQGDHGLRAPEVGPQEVREVAINFNAMLDTVSEQQAALAAREHQTRALFENSHVAQLIVSPKSGEVQNANAAAAALLGAEGPADMVGQPLSAYWSTLQPWPEQRWSNLVPEVPERFETPLKNPLSQLPWMAEVHWLRIVDHGLDVVHVNVVDVTDRYRRQLQDAQAKEDLERRVAERTSALQQSNTDLQQTVQQLEEAQNQLVEAEKQAALGRLVAGMAHEVNTPLGNAQLAVTTLAAAHAAFAQSVQSGLRRSDWQRYEEQFAQTSEMAERSLARVAELVGTFKQVAADQANSAPRRFNLTSLVNDVMSILMPQLRRKSVDVHIAIPSDLELFSHAGPIEQVLVNLVGNALMHGFDGRPGGRLSIEAQELKSGWVELSVIDDGVGIADEHRHKVFDPFFTTKLGRGGLGLGLSIVHTLVNQVLGGRIHLHSALHNGTRFVLTFPKEVPSVAD